MLPSDVRDLVLGGVIKGWVALDTETSGLYVDAGARVSTVSMAWFMPGEPPNKGEGVQDHTPQYVYTDRYEDIDGSGLVRVVSVAWPFDQGVTNTGKPEDDGQDSLWPDAENLPKEEWLALLMLLKRLAEQKRLVFHNAKFDVHMMLAGCRRWPGLGVDLIHGIKWDSQAGADMLWRWAGTTSLKPTSMRLWGEEEGDEQKVIKSYLTKKKLPSGRWDLMPWDIIGKYADQDPRLTLRMAVRQMAEMNRLTKFGPEDKGKWLDGQDGRLTYHEAFERRLGVTRFLIRMERRGLPFNVDGSRKVARRLKAEVKRLKGELPFKPATLPMAKHYWFGDGEKQGVTGLGLVPYGTTDSGDVQLDKTILAKMVKAELPGAATWQSIVALENADSRWYTGYADRAGVDGRLRTSVRQNGTASGRFSVENIQLQAIPHDYRLTNEVLKQVASPRQLIGQAVPEGYRLWELDLAQAELRVAALFAGCDRMLRLIDEGADLHGDACQELFGLTPSAPNWGQMRNVAKRANFSLIFGVGWRKLQQDIEEQTGIVLSDAQAQKLVYDWNALYPEYKRAINKHMNRVEARKVANGGRGWLTMANGERRWFGRDEDCHKAFNQRVQPSLAQFGIDWWLSVEAKIMDALGPEGDEANAGLVLVIHDSMVLLLPDNSVGEGLVKMAIEEGRRLWAETFRGVPGDVDAKQWKSD